MEPPRPWRDIGWARQGRRWSAGVAFLAIALLGSSRAGAEGAQADSPTPAPQRIVVTFEQRTRAEGLTHPFRVDELGLTRVLALRTRVQVAFPRIVGPLGAFVELQDSRSTWNDTPFVVPARHVNHLDFKQVQLRLASERIFGERASGGILVGRYTLDVGRRRLVARNAMRNTTNAFDGALGWLTARDGSSVQAFVSRPVRLEPYDLDWSDGERLFWGAWLTLRRWPALQAETYALRLDESADTVTQRCFTTLGGRLFRSPSPGGPDYETELAWQTGTQRGREHRAFLAHLEAGFTFRRGRSRLAVLYDHASGDRDPGDDRSERFDTLFGARAFEYAPTGIYGPFFRSNIEGSGVRVTVVPRPSLEALVAHRALWLSEAKDAWVGSGLQDPTGDSGRFLGHSLEARLRWRPRRWMLVEAAYAHLFKGTFVERAPNSPRTPDCDYLTVGVEFGGQVLAR